MDLHVHTDVSDGVFNVDKVVEIIAQSHISTFSITDHNSVRAVPRAIELAYGYDLTCIPGIELSCRNVNPNIAFSTEVPVHILGYNIDTENPSRVLQANRFYLTEQEMIKHLLSYFSDQGIFIKRALSADMREGDEWIRMRDFMAHIRGASLSHADKEASLAVIFSHLDELFLESVGIGEGVEAIRGAGGVAVWAHPFKTYVNSDQAVRVSREELVTVLDYFREGLSGVEVTFSEVAHPDTAFLFEEATKRNLFVTIGSDYHGYPGRDRLVDIEADWSGAAREALVNKCR